MLGFVMLSVLGLGFLLLPIFVRSLKQGAGVQPETSRSWYRSRLAELDDDAADQEVRDEIKAELGAVLLAETPAAKDMVRPISNDHDDEALGRKILSVASIGLIVMSTVVYSNLGDHRLPEIRGAEAVLELSADTQEAAILSWQERLKFWTADNPEDAKSWYLLGHSYLKLGTFDQAAESFANTNALVDNDVSVKFYWLQSRYLVNKGVLDDTSKRLAEEILQVDPTNDSVLEILAIAAINDGDNTRAIKLLNQSLSGLRDSRRQAATIQAIDRLRDALTAQPEGITVQVSAKAQADTSATVFVVARPVGGGMPYAAVRRPAALLPFSVRIDDLVSMSDQRKLSSAEEFEIMVRLSVSGVAQAQEGDWVWRSQPFTGNKPSKEPIQAVLAPSADLN